jgi:hypothetical protein
MAPSHTQAHAASTPVTRPTTSTGSSQNAIACTAVHIRFDNTYMAHAMCARRVLDYNMNPSLRRPPPLPIPVLEYDKTGSQLTRSDQCVSMILPINIGAIQ